MNFWNSLPSALRSYLVSFTLTAQSVLATMVTVGYGLGLCGSLEATIHYVVSNAWAGLMAAFLGIGPYYRAHKAVTANVQAGLPGNSSAPSAVVATPKPVVYTEATTYAPPNLPPALPVVTPPNPIGTNESMNATINEVMVILNLFLPNNPIVKDIEVVLTGLESGGPFSVPLSLGGKPGVIGWNPSA